MNFNLHNLNTLNFKEFHFKFNFDNLKLFPFEVQFDNLNTFFQVGLFIAGMFLPCVDSRGALIGFTLSLSHNLTISISISIEFKAKASFWNFFLGFVGSSLLTGWMAVRKTIKIISIFI